MKGNTFSQLEAAPCRLVKPAGYRYVVRCITVSKLGGYKDKSKRVNLFSDFPLISVPSCGIILVLQELFVDCRHLQLVTSGCMKIHSQEVWEPLLYIYVCWGFQTIGTLAWKGNLWLLLCHWQILTSCAARILASCLQDVYSHHKVDCLSCCHLPVNKE